MKNTLVARILRGIIVKKPTNISKDQFIRTTGIISFILCILFIPFLFIFYDEIYAFISKYKLAFSYIAAVGAFYSISFSGYQTWMYKRQHYSNFDKEKILKSIELAERYKMILDTDVFYLLHVLSIVGVTDEYNKFNYGDFKQFSSKEMKKKFSEPQIEKLTKLLMDINFKEDDTEKVAKAYYKDKNRHTDFYQSAIAKKIQLSKSGQSGGNSKMQLKIKDQKEEISVEESQEIFEQYRLQINHEAYLEMDIIRDDFNMRIFSALNSLEWFAMNFKNGIANDNVLYQSLHQSYLEFIKLMYFLISYLNSDPKSKYFINVIWLYRFWTDKFEEICKKEESQEDELLTQSDSHDI